MYEQIKKHIKIPAMLLFFLVVLIVARTIQIEVEYRRNLEKIGIALNTEATVLGIAEAIPNQFKIGSSREDVLEKIHEIYPDMDDESYSHSFLVCNSGGCFDYIAFYEDVASLELGFRFVYDDSDNLTTIEYAPGS